jgi:predicted DNA-binding transcriptional regulator AlpA
MPAPVVCSYANDKLTFPGPARTGGEQTAWPRRHNFQAGVSTN